ncbi:hypothetical protein OG285_04570 [Streptomyces sp. NBC_01471]|uniref:HGxxPAAW family protein n=1 Tax=Streptomyces sp. NBC_01471 TaxID=2903879 RepID=UPI003246F156
MSGHQHDEGHTVAGWASSAIAMVGAAVAGAGIAGWSPGIWAGSAVTALAPLVAWSLHLAGWGKPPGVRAADQWGLHVRDRTARGGHAGCLGCRLAGRRGVSVRTDGPPEPAVTAARAGT